MDKKTIKRIVAREGLIILASFVLANLPAIVNTLFPHRLTGLIDSARMAYGNIVAGWIIPMYLLTRFIIWAVRTLRER